MYNVYYFSNNDFHGIHHFESHNYGAFDALRFLWQEYDGSILNTILSGISTNEYFPHIDYVDLLKRYDTWRSGTDATNFPYVEQYDGRCESFYVTSENLE